MKAYVYSEVESKFIESILAPFNGIISGSVWSLEHKGLSEIKIKIKKHYLKEQNSTCAVCKQRILVAHAAAWDIEHIVSRDENSNFCFEPLNLCVTCKDCNIEKSDKKVLIRSRKDKYSKKTGQYVIIHPHFDKYSEHIDVIEAGLLYNGKTDKGKCTIKTYGLKRFLHQRFLPECSTNDLAEKFLAVAKILSEGEENVDHLIALVSINYAIENKIKNYLS